MRLVLHLLINTVAIMVTAYLLPGVHIGSWVTALIVAIVLGAINLFIRPVILVLTLPINILTLGLFTLVINALLIMLAATLVPGFQVAGFLWALIFGMVLWLIASFLHSLK